MDRTEILDRRDRLRRRAAQARPGRRSPRPPPSATTSRPTASTSPSWSWPSRTASTSRCPRTTSRTSRPSATPPTSSSPPLSRDRRVVSAAAVASPSPASGVVSPPATTVDDRRPGRRGQGRPPAPIRPVRRRATCPSASPARSADLDFEGRIGAREARRIDRAGLLALVAADRRHRRRRPRRRSGRRPGPGRAWSPAPASAGSPTLEEQVAAARRAAERGPQPGQPVTWSR